MNQYQKKSVIRIPNFGTVEAIDNPNDPTGSIQLTGGAAGPEAARIIGASLQEAADTYLRNSAYSIPPLEPENKTIFGWFAYYDLCLEKGLPRTHEELRQRYNNQCDLSERIENPATWRAKYCRWKKKG